MIKHGGCHSCYWDNEKEHNERRILWLYNTKESTNPMPWLTISAFMQLVSMVHVTSLTVLLTNRALMSNKLNFVYNWLADRFQRHKYFLAYPKTVTHVLTCILINPWKRCYRILVSW